MEHKTKKMFSLLFRCGLKYFMMIALLTIISGNVFPQQVSVSVKTDTNSILIGDQVHLDLKMTLPSGYRLRMPDIGDTIVKDLQVISRSKTDTAFSEDKKTMTVTQRIRFTSFDSGFYSIPSMMFQYKTSEDTNVKTIFSEPISLVVHTMAVDTTRAIKPIKDPLRIPLSFREMLPWIIGGIIILLIAGVIIYIILKRKKQQPVFQIRPRIRLKPEETALMELERLKLKKLWQNNRVKDYHTELTDILRKYLEARYEMMAMEKTSAEILFELEKKNTSGNTAMAELEEILTMADMVKFAKAEPLPAENEESYDLAVKFVHETTPAESAEKHKEER